MGNSESIAAQKVYDLLLNESLIPYLLFFNNHLFVVVEL